MSMVIIDPPVGPYSDRAEIEKWIRELETRRDEANDVGAREAYVRAIAEAKAWLSVAS